MDRRRGVVHAATDFTARAQPPARERLEPALAPCVLSL
jgi:hypothetical protein